MHTKLAETYRRPPDAIGIDMPTFAPVGRIKPIPFGKIPKTNLKVYLNFGSSGYRWGRVTGLEVEYGDFWQQLWRMDFHNPHSSSTGDYDDWNSGGFHYHVLE